MPFGGRSPLETLALPGVILAYKYSQFRQRRREAASRRVTERELSALHHKIDKLLNKLEESEPEPPTSQEDECVICINARATMQTSPCGHRVVCRRCFVKTIQSAVAQRLLPLRCVICRARVNRLTSGADSWRLQESASSYSMGTTKSWNVTSSTSAYSVGGRVAQSSSLYSMSSGSSNVSGVSNLSNGSTNSRTSGASSASSISKGSTDSISNHRHHESCGSNCLGAIPRTQSHHSKRSAHHYSNKGRLNELQNRLPPIKEFRSPTKAPLNSPNHVITNPRLRYASYTSKPNTPDTVPLLGESSSISKPASASKLSLMAKVAPTKPKISTTNMASGVVRPESAPSTSRSGYSLISNGKTDERADNKKNESAEKRKKEEKLKIKAEKEARKEEKRLAKEEERMAKLIAKEEKKKGKKESKELFVQCDNEAKNKK